MPGMSPAIRRSRSASRTNISISALAMGGIGDVVCCGISTAAVGVMSIDPINNQGSPRRKLTVPLRPSCYKEYEVDLSSALRKTRDISASTYQVAQKN